MPANNEKQVLLNLLAQRLGKKPEELQQQAQNGNLQNLLSGMDPNDAAKLQQVLSDQQAVQKLMSSPQAQALLKKLQNK
ncbi:conserved protein of unknown function [Ruminococcaceae bacterium BL-6]|jgi:flagellar motility protein MotE (MotC chaperone)|nr:conserved protein of unknown function [Ruminococcaceae bacterium BL-6]HBC26597.1 hypothetical protein [Oscillospiraceae bacterium]